MVPPVGMPSFAGRSAIGRATAVLTLIAMLAGCGSSVKSGASASTSGPPKSCPATVLDTLGRVLNRVYREGIFSERTAAARHVIAASIPLRRAVEGGDAAAASAAARELLAGGHMTNLRVIRGTRTLVDVGGAALTPLKGTIADASGKAIASYVTSVWADAGFVAEGEGVAEGLVALRANGASVGGSFALPPGQLPSGGTLTAGGVLYQFTSFPAEAFPSGPVTVYLLRPVSSTTALCGSGSEDTVVNTLSRVARLIYGGEAGKRTLTQIRRVQRDAPLLEAVARRDPTATRLAVEALLSQHIVRLRVSAGHTLLSDVGGPYVLAPVSAPLRLGRRTIGSFVLSIQDDEGYKRLAGRLAGLKVLMYMSTKLVKNSLGPSPGAVPASGHYSYRGHDFRVLTIDARAFPSGPLTIRVLIPIPYS